MLRLSRPLR